MGLIKGILETALVALVVFGGLKYGVQNVRVDGSSMEPTLQNGQFLIANKLVYLRFSPETAKKWLPFLDSEEPDGGSVFAFHPPERQEVVIFSQPEHGPGYFIKRVIGVPGDTVELRRGRVFVNGTRIDEPYITSGDRTTKGPVVVPEGKFYVLGDNRGGSTDSRTWGPIEQDKIMGRAWVSFWPVDKFSTLTALFR